MEKFNLIVTIINKGYADSVMKTARSVGANGGTIMRARGTGSKESGTFFGVAIEPEKDMVLIIVDETLRPAIMHEISEQMPEESQCICLALPVEDAIGVKNYPTKE